MAKLIYLDNAATTQVYPEVLDAMLPYFTEYYGNPSAIYSFAGESKKAVDEARANVAALINARTEDIYFTGGLARLTAMTQDIANTLSLNVHQLDELMPDSLAGPHTVDSCPAVLGALLQGDGK